MTTNWENEVPPERTPNRSRRAIAPSPPRCEDVSNFNMIDMYLWFCSYAIARSYMTTASGEPSVDWEMTRYQANATYMGEENAPQSPPTTNGTRHLE